MTQQTAPFLETKWGWNYGESGWNSGMDENLLKFSALLEKNINGIVSSVPLPAVNGTTYFNTTDNRLYFAVNNVYYSSPTPKWITLCDTATGQNYQFNGASLSQVASASDLDGRLTLTEAQIDLLGTAAFQSTTFFENQSQAQVDVLKNDLASVADSKGAWLVGFERDPVLDVLTVQQSLSSKAINLLEFASLVTSKPNPSDPETWDWAPAFDALTAAARTYGLDLELPPIKLKTSKTFVVPAGQIARGKGGGGYITEIVDPTMWKTVITKINGNVGGSYVVDVEKSAQLWDVQVAPEDRSYAPFDYANYVVGSGNVNNGVRLQQASRAQGVTAIAFPDTGFEIGMITKCTDCYAFMCTQGFKTRTNEGDASLVECIAMFCYQYGADLRGGYWKVIGGRFEWNARHGIGGSSSFSCIGATFDRNGWSGVYLPQGLEQATVTGNLFRRNGAGGDGAVGRTSWMVTTHPGYVFTANENSCHIKIDGQKRIEIVGNSYAPGKDDAGGGADAPKYVYASSLVTNSTALDGVVIIGNHGDRGETFPGYAPLYNGGGAGTFGGNDANLINYYNPRGTVIPMAVRSDVFQGSLPQSASAVSSIDISVPKASSGKISISMKQAFASEYAEIFFATNASGTGYTTKVVNQLGVNATTATMASGTAPFDIVTINFTNACFVKYSIMTT